MASTDKGIQLEGWQVTVPATSANLGCAFDCAGLALQLYLHASFFPSPSGSQVLMVEYHGRNPDRVPVDDSNLLLRSMRLACNRLGLPAPGGRVIMHNDIPVGAGLGSSASAVVAGLLLALHHHGRHPQIPEEQLLAWAGEIEGHADNASAALCGGLVFALEDHGRVKALRTAFPEALRLVVVVPSVMVSTREARGVLPRSYERAEALHSLQRAVAFAATCFSGKCELLPEMFDDRLHQPYRGQLVPGIARCLQYRHDGLRGTVISGSGPSILAFAEQNSEPIAAGLRQIFMEEGVRTETFTLSADNRGAVITPMFAPAAELVNAAQGENR